MGGINIAAPLMAISLGASSLSLGILGSSLSVSYISLCFFFAKLSERWHRKNLLLLGSLAYVATSLLFSFSSQIYHLYLARLLMGIAGAMFWPILQAWIADKESKRTLVRRMALFNVSWGTGATVGPLIGGILCGISLKLPFYFAFLVSVLVFFVVFYKTPKASLSSKSKTFTGKTFFSEDPPDNSSLYIKISRIASFILCFCTAMVFYIFPKLGTQLQMSPSFLGFLMFVLSLFRVLTFYGLGRVQQWHYRIFPLALFQLMAAVGLIMISLVSSFPLFILAFAFLGASQGMTFSSSLFYSVNVTSQKGPSVGMHETVIMSGFFLGPLIGGAIAQESSLRAPYLVAAAIVVMGIFTQLLLKRRYDLLQRVTAS